MFKGEETPVIELLEQEPDENNMTITTEEETLLVGEIQGKLIYGTVNTHNQFQIFNIICIFHILPHLISVF